MLLIGLGHRSGHGKDTVADYMLEWFRGANPSLRVAKFPWAWKLKEICYDLYKHLGMMPPAYYDTDFGRIARDVKLPRINLTPVEIWVKVGTPAIREQVWDDTWIEYNRNRQNIDVLLVPDTRFPNELAVCDFTIKVNNSRIANRKGVSVDDTLANYVGWHAYINNEFGFSELRGATNDLCMRLFTVAGIVNADTIQLAIQHGYRNLYYTGSLMPFYERRPAGLERGGM